LDMFEGGMMAGMAFTLSCFCRCRELLGTNLQQQEMRKN
jgi:hypothetical protein